MDVQPLLVVEDETLIRLGLVDLFETGGFTVSDAADGKAAIDAIERLNTLCGLVTDVNLGSEANGWSVARQARKKFPDLAVVYITGDSVSEWPSEGVPNSAIVQKPFADAQIVTAVTAQLLHSGPQSGQSDVATSQ